MMLIWLDQDEYEDKQKELEGIFNPIIQDLYAQAGGPPGGEMPGTNFYLFISIISSHIFITSTKAKNSLSMGINLFLISSLFLYFFSLLFLSFFFAVSYLDINIYQEKCILLVYFHSSKI